MGLIEIVILAVVQALTEFLPVSSSGHLLALSELTAIDSTLALDVMLHVGTLLALVAHFWRKLWEIATNLLQGRDSRLFTRIVVSTLPAVLAGALFGDFFSDEVRHVEVVIVTLLAVGGLFLVADKIFPKKNNQKLDEISNKTALIIGLTQILALIPGTSRSGITILAAKSQGLSNQRAAEYSFLIGVPIIFGASVQTLLSSDTRAVISNDLGLTLLGIVVAAVTGLAVIRWLLGYLANHSLAIFGYYRIALALLLLLLINV